MAANNLGEAGLLLYADTGRLKSDMGAAASIVQKNTEAMQTRTIAMGVAIGNVIGHVVSEAVSKFAELIPQTIERMDKLQKAAEKVGLPTAEFSKLNYAAKLADVSMETLEKSLGKLIKSQAAGLKATSEQAKIFNALGVSIKNADGSLRSSSDVLGQFADRFKLLKGSPEAIAAGLKIFGRGFQEMIPLLERGSEGLREAGAEADRFGVTLSDSVGKAAEEANENIKRLHTVFDGLAQQVVAALLPQLNNLLTWAVAFVADGKGAADIANEISSGFGAIVEAAKAVGQVVGILKQVETAYESVGKAAQDSAPMWAKVVNVALSQQFPGIVAPFGGQQKQAPSNFTGPAFLQVPELNRRSFSAVPTVADFTKPDGSKTAAALRAVFDGSDKAAKTHKAHAAAVKDLTSAVNSFNDTLGRLQGFLDGPLKKADEQHIKNMRQLTEEATKGKVGHDKLTAALAVESQAYAKEIEDIKSRYATEISALLGPVARAQDQHRLALRDIDRLQREGAISSGEMTAALKEEAKAYNLATLAAQRAVDPLKTLLADMQRDVDLIGMSNAERSVANELMVEGIALYGKEGQAALAQARMIEKLGSERQKNIQFMDNFRSGLADLGITAVYNFGSIGKSFKKMMDDLAQQISRRIIENWIEKAFGPQGSTGQGTQSGGGIWSLIGKLLGSSGGNQAAGTAPGEASLYAKSVSPGGLTGGGSGGGFWSSVIGWASSLYGGGHASGGPVSAGRFYEVGEGNKPEMLSMSGRSYLIPGNSGQVTPMRGGGRTTLNQTFVVQGAPDSRTREQMARASGREARRGMARTGA
jgi:hypothetical protein